jgi:hypothetical protein
MWNKEMLRNLLGYRVLCTGVTTFPLTNHFYRLLFSFVNDVNYYIKLILYIVTRYENKIIALRVHESSSTKGALPNVYFLQIEQSQSLETVCSCTIQKEKNVGLSSKL